MTQQLDLVEWIKAQESKKAVTTNKILKNIGQRRRQEGLISMISEA